MRILTIGVLAAAALGCVSTAVAADLDYDVLRGADDGPLAAPVIDWGGAYLGGHGGYSSAALGFTNVFQPIVASALRSTATEQQLGASTLLAPHSVRVDGPSYGAFVGYNVQLDSLVVGVEFDYTRFDVGGTTSDSIARFMTGTDGYFRAVALDGASSTKIKDYGTLRARVGYAIDNFLPFVTGGAAIGRARIQDTVHVQEYGYNQAAYNANQTSSSGKPQVVDYFGYKYMSTFDPSTAELADPVPYGKIKTKTVGGFALGAGLEYAITSNILLRGEYQYVLFSDFDRHKTNINTVRGGAALKF